MRVVRGLRVHGYSQTTPETARLLSWDPWGGWVRVYFMHPKLRKLLGTLVWMPGSSYGLRFPIIKSIKPGTTSSFGGAVTGQPMNTIEYRYRGIGISSCAQGR